MKLTVSRSDRVTVTVHAYEIDGNIEATHDKGEIPKGMEDIQEAAFTFRRPGHADSTSIFKECNFKPTAEGKIQSFDVTVLQEAVLRTLLVGWDLMDDDGKKMSLTAGNINSLHPAVARAASAGCLDKIRL